MTAHPQALLAVLLGLAVLCLGIGTLRGSFRIWLAGYALIVAAVFVAGRQARSARLTEPGRTAPVHVPVTAPRSVGMAGPTGGSPAEPRS